MMKGIEVYILGQKYLLKGEGSPQYMKELAEFVDSKIREVLKNSPNMPPLKAAIIASLNITDELFKLRDQQKAIIDYVNEKAEALSLLFSDE